MAVCASTARINMTQDEIIEMARQAEFVNLDLCSSELERFAKLVAAKEREACAKLLESRKTGANELMDAVRDMEAKAIRARKQA
jgi:hypothetical protein